MRGIIARITLITLLIAVAFHARATVITIDFSSNFDSIFSVSGDNGTTGPFGGPNGYQTLILDRGMGNTTVGFLRSNTPATDSTPEQVSSVTFESLIGPFSLNSLDLVGAWGSQTAKVVGFRNNNTIETAGLTEFVDINYDAVDTVQPNWTNLSGFSIVASPLSGFTSAQGDGTCCGPAGSVIGNQIAFDNIVISTASTSNEVLEPSSAFLLALGVFGLTCVRHHRSCARGLIISAHS